MNELKARLAIAQTFGLVQPIHFFDDAIVFEVPNDKVSPGSTSRLCNALNIERDHLDVERSPTHFAFTVWDPKLAKQTHPVLRLLQHRRQASVSAAEIARRSGKNRSSIARFEDNKDPRWSALQDYANALGLSVEVYFRPSREPY